MKRCLQRLPGRPDIGWLLVVPVVAAAVAIMGCAPQEVAPPSPLPALPNVNADAPRTTAPATEAPVAVNFKTTTQLKLQASQHWTSIGDDAAKGISSLLRRAGICSDRSGACRPVYVKPPATLTQFSRAFYNQLITALVRGGITVSTDPAGSLLADIDVQPVVFSPNRPQYRYAGVPVELGPGIWALRDVSTVVPTDPRSVPPTVDALHWFRTEFASGATPKTEILITVSVASRDRYLARSSNAYYVADDDRQLYFQEICSLFTPCSAQPAPDAKPDPGKAITIVGDCPVDKCIYPPGEAAKPVASTAPPPARAATAKKKK